MVGERYRDLIDAADTIADMTKCAKNVLHSISHVEQLCQRLKEDFMIHGINTRQKKTDVRQPQDASLQETATQIKLLLDIPEKIWSALEEKDFLSATRLFLLSRHINTGLHLKSSQSQTLLSSFPVASRQWATISHFKEAILKSCHEMLQRTDVTDLAVADALCCVMLLEDVDLLHILQDLLSLRQGAIRQLLRAEEEQTNIKDQVCNVLNLVLITIHQVNLLFTSDPGLGETAVKGCQLTEKLRSLVAKTALEDNLIERHVSTRCLPKTVTDYRPNVRCLDDSLDMSIIQELCQRWCQECVDEVKDNLSDLLVFVHNVKRLADIRDTLWDALSKDSHFDTWDVICERVLCKRLNLWKTFLQDLFIQRVETLVESQLKTITESIEDYLIKVIIEASEKPNSVEHDVSQFIWTEESKDIPTNMAWMPSSHKSFSSTNGLLMKTWAITPVIQSVCDSFNGKLEELLQDVCCFLKSDEVSESEIGSFDRFSSDNEIVQKLRSAGITCVKRLITSFERKLKEFHSNLEKEANSMKCIPILKRIVLLGRFCSVCCLLTSKLSQCIMGPDVKHQRLTKTISERKSEKSYEAAQWEGIKKCFMDTQLSAFSIWTDYTIKVVLHDLTELMNSDKRSNILLSFTQWEEIEITEDSEEGKAIKSTIKVPLHASWPLQRCLFDVCKAINYIGSHVLSRATLLELVCKLSDGVVGCVRDASKEMSANRTVLRQPTILQMLFDVKFMQTIFPRKEHNERNLAYQKMCKELIMNLEEGIDPFDLDVFSPYIQSNLNKQARRCLILYGVLMTTERPSIHGGAPLSTSHTDLYNAIPLAMSSSRFALLPISTETNKMASTFSFTKESKQSERLINADSIATSSGSTVNTVADKLTKSDNIGSFYNRIGSVSQLWFSNVDY